MKCDFISLQHSDQACSVLLSLVSQAAGEGF